MKEQLVTFEVAKLAKEKRFNTDTDSIYKKDGILYNVLEEGFLAPSQNLLQKWLREVHKIYVTILPWKDHQDDVNDDYRFRPMIVGLKTFGEYKTWEEALEVGLQEGLQLIK